MTNRSLLSTALCMSCSMAFGSLSAATTAEIEAEISGESTSPLVLPITNPAARDLAMGQLPTAGLLLIPESSNDRVMAFNVNSGDLIDPDFIASDPTNLSTPIHAILAGDGNSFLVSDQIEDVVQEYDMNGIYLGVFAPATGLDNNILDNIRGIALDDSGNLQVTVGSGANADAIASFDVSGIYLGNLVANGAGGMDSPFDVVFRSADILVGAITSDAIHQYDNGGTYLADLLAVDGFPEQIVEEDNGNLLIANFSGTQEGIIITQADGTVLNVLNPVQTSGYRGVYPLGNGNLLVTTGNGVHEIDRNGNFIEDKITGVSARFIEFVRGGPPPVPQTVPVNSPMWLLLLITLMLVTVSIMSRSRKRLH